MPSLIESIILHHSNQISASSSHLLLSPPYPLVMFDDEKDDNNTQIIRETPTKKRKKSSNNKHNITLCGAALAHNVIRKHSELAQALIKHTLNYSQQPFHINMFQTIKLTGQVRVKKLSKKSNKLHQNSH